MKKLTITFTLLSAISISYSQNVGINTDGSAPGMMLHVKVPSGNDGIRIQNNSGTGDGIINFQDAAASAWTIGFDADNANRFVFDNGAALTTTNVMVLETTGDVGIGINNPTAQLTVNADAIFNESGGANNFRVESDGNQNAFFVDAADNQVGIFVAGSAIATVDFELNENDGAIPLARFINTSATGTPLIGVGQNASSGGSWIAGAGLSGTAEDAPGVSGHALTTTTQGFGGYFVNDGAFAEVGGWEMGPWTVRKIIGNGSVSTIVDDLDGGKVSMTCPEAPEIVFQDFGTGKLENGIAHIDIDPIMTKNIHVDDAHPLKVYIQLEGDCNGVYVFNKTASGFDVKELNNGSSNAEFSWMIVANRANVEFRYSDGTTKVSNNIGNRFSPVQNWKVEDHLLPEGVRQLEDYISIPVSK